MFTLTNGKNVSFAFLLKWYFYVYPSYDSKNPRNLTQTREYSKTWTSRQENMKMFQSFEV